MPESLGRYLRRERQMRDVSLEQIAGETKISLAILEAIEADRFESHPSPAIVKGFLRAYARIVGLSENAVVLRYESLLEERGLAPRGPGSIRQQVPRKPFRLAPVVWLLLVVLGLGVGLRLFDRQGRPPGAETEGKRADQSASDTIVYRKNYLRELATEAPAGTPARLGEEDAELEPPAGGGVHLRLRASAPLSVRVVLDSGASETIALTPGQEVARHAERGAVVETSHPERLFLEANGRPVEATLTGARAVRILLTPVAGAASGEEGAAALPEVAARVLPLAPQAGSLAPPPSALAPD